MVMTIEHDAIRVVLLQLQREKSVADMVHKPNPRLGALQVECSVFDTANVQEGTIKPKAGHVLSCPPIGEWSERTTHEKNAVATHKYHESVGGHMINTNVAHLHSRTHRKTASRKRDLFWNLCAPS